MTVDSSYPSFYLIPSLSQAHTLSPFFFFFSPPEIPLWFISRPTYYSRFFLLVPHDGCPSKLEGRAWKPSVYTWLPTPQKDKRNSLAFILVRSLEKSYTLHPTPPPPTHSLFFFLNTVCTESLSSNQTAGLWSQTAKRLKSLSPYYFVRGPISQQGFHYCTFVKGRYRFWMRGRSVRVRGGGG